MKDRKCKIINENQIKAYPSPLERGKRVKLMKNLIYLLTIIFIIVSCNNNNEINEEKSQTTDSVNTEITNDSTNSKTVSIDTISDINNLKKDSVRNEETKQIITVETSKSPCIITKIFSENNKNYIVVDYTRMTDKEEEESGMPIYENKNPKLRTFLINNSTEITTFDWQKNTDTGVWKITLNEFLENKENQISNYTKWNIEVENGIVIKLNEIYYP